MRVMAYKECKLLRTDPDYIEHVKCQFNQKSKFQLQFFIDRIFVNLVWTFLKQQLLQ